MTKVNYCANCKAGLVCIHIKQLRKWLDDNTWLLNNMTSNNDKPAQEFILLLGEWCYFRRSGEFDDKKEAKS